MLKAAPVPRHGAPTFLEPAGAPDLWTRQAEGQGEAGAPEEPPSQPSPLPHLYADLRPQIHFLSVLLLEAMTSQSEMRVQTAPLTCCVTNNGWPSGPERSLLKVPYQSSASGLEPHLGHVGTVPSR